MHPKDASSGKERRKWGAPKSDRDLISPRSQERKKWEPPKQDDLFEKLSAKTLLPGTYVVAGLKCASFSLVNIVFKLVQR